MRTGLKGTLRSGRRVRSWLALGIFVLLAAAVALLGPWSSEDPDRSPVAEAQLSQKGKALILQVESDGDPLLPDPKSGKGSRRRACLELKRPDAAAVAVCAGRGTGRRRVSVSRPDGRQRVIPARIRRRSAGFVMSFEPGAAGLAPGQYEWRVVAHTGRCPEEGPLTRPSQYCVASFPEEGNETYELRPVRVVGCTGGDGEFLEHGPRGRRRVALTFDDGPGPFTVGVLRALKERRAPATFFMLGNQVERYPALARMVLAQGHEIGNHSYEHDLLPSRSSVREATRQIRSATGFRPCTFRPPYGAVDRKLRRIVRKDRMKVINWDVDPSDWTRPGPGAIARLVVNQVRPGSIVLMHDGGGPRGGTVAALARTVFGLRQQGYELVTVSELLGNRRLYRPVE